MCCANIFWSGIPSEDNAFSVWDLDILSPILADHLGSLGNRKVAELPAAEPQLRGSQSGESDFRVIGSQEKRTLPRTAADISSFSYVAVQNSGAGIRINRLPFRRTTGCSYLGFKNPTWT